MFNHVMVGSNDIDRSRKFYDAVLGVFGAGRPVHDTAPTGHVRLFYRHNGNTFCVSEPIDGRAASPANGGTIAFACGDAEQVVRFHQTALTSGGESIEEPPGVRENAAGPVHLAYVRDPDGNKLRAIYRP